MSAELELEREQALTKAIMYLHANGAHKRADLLAPCVAVPAEELKQLRLSVWLLAQHVVSVNKWRFPPDFPGGAPGFTTESRELVLKLGLIRERDGYMELAAERPL